MNPLKSNFFKFVPLLGLVFICGCINRIDIFGKNKNSSTNGSTPAIISEKIANFFAINYPNTGDISKLNKTTKQLEIVTNTLPHSQYNQIISDISHENDEFLYLYTDNNASQEIHRMKISDGSMTGLTLEDGVTHALDPYDSSGGSSYKRSGDAVAVYRGGNAHLINSGSSSQFTLLSSFTNSPAPFYAFYPLGKKYFLLYDVDYAPVLLNASITDPSQNFTSLTAITGTEAYFQKTMEKNSNSVLFSLEKYSPSYATAVYYLNYNSGTISSVLSWSANTIRTYTTKGGDFILIDLDPTPVTGGGKIYKVDQLSGSISLIATHTVPQGDADSLFTCESRSSKVNVSDTEIYLACGAEGEQVNLYKISTSGNGSFNSYTIAANGNSLNSSALHYYQDQLYIQKDSASYFNLEKLTIVAGTPTFTNATQLMNDIFQGICTGLSNPANCVQNVTISGGSSVSDFFSSTNLSGAHTFDKNLGLGFLLDSFNFDNTTYYNRLIVTAPSGTDYFNTNTAELEPYLKFFDIYGPTATGNFIYFVPN